MKISSLKSYSYFVGTLVISVFLFSSCAAGGSATEDSTLDSSQLGTILGNPTTPTSSLTIKSTSGAVAATDYCLPYSIDLDNIDLVDATRARTQRCHEIPQDYRAVILQIYLLECVGADGVAVTCTPNHEFMVSQRVSVYSGSVQVNLDGIGSMVDLDFLNLTQTLNVGGIQFVTQSLGQKIPQDGEAGAERVVATLRGKSYRVCTTPDGAKCGAEGAVRGDTLIDMNGDGTYGFVDTATLTADFISETATKPVDYSDFSVDQVAKAQYSFSHNPAVEYTDGVSFGETAGLFAPILGLVQLAAIDPETAYTFTATVNVDETFMFIDGARGGYTDELCVSALSSTPCEGEDADPASVGIYNPFYDGQLLLESPTTIVTVETIE